jgi:multicomponent Na+:H+ antiporter subunit G
MMNDLLAAILLLVGASFLLLAGVGVLRMPDLFTRMQSATKASTLGVAAMLLAVAAHFGELGVTTRAIATSVFFLLTAPVTAHLIGRAAYFLGVPLWHGTVRDELQGRYDLRTHMLDSFATTVPSPVMDANTASTGNGQRRTSTAQGGDGNTDHPIIP